MSIIEKVLDFVFPVSSQRTVEERNTVYYPRVHSFPRKYVYGERPEDPFAAFKEQPAKKVRLACESEKDPEVISRHFAKCLEEEGSHGGLCEMCKLLNNPKRFDFLVRLYRDDRPMDLAGLNVTGASDGAKVNLSATSEYLKGLAEIGLIRRERAGRLVNYTPDFSLAKPCVGEIARMMRERIRKDPNNLGFVPVFRAMMGSRRSRIVRHIASGGCGHIPYLIRQFEFLQLCDLIRDLKAAVEAHILDLDSQDSDGTYAYITPADPIARRIVELS